MQLNCWVSFIITKFTKYAKANGFSKKDIPEDYVTVPPIYKLLKLLQTLGKSTTVTDVEHLPTQTSLTFESEQKRDIAVLGNVIFQG